MNMGVFVEQKKRTHTCGELRPSHVGTSAVLMGWVQSVRVHSRWVFIDLRDREGITQVVCQPEASQEAFELAGKVRQEYVVAVEGDVAMRSGTPNPKLPTGEIEVVARSLEVLNRARPLPLQVADEVDANEDTRLEHRYLDLRRRPLVEALGMRSKMYGVIRRTLEALRFWEFETPILGKSTPEGARDYLVPSRTHPGQFYALPQSPQLYKQLFMIAGYDRYYQIARCFRDEDLRGERQPEFTQLDIEMSFVTPADVQDVVEQVTARIFAECLGVEVPLPLPRMSFADAMSRYGSDKPDLRYDLPLTDVTDLVRTSELPALAGAKTAKALRLQAQPSRKQLEALAAEVTTDYKPALIGWAKRQGAELVSGVGKKLDPATLPALFERLGLGEGDLMLLVAGDAEERTCQAAGRMRERAAAMAGLVPAAPTFALTWIEGFPMFEWDETEKRWAARHHPFTSPWPEDLENLERDPGSVRARAYDLVCNGSEVAGGSIRIHDPEVQLRVLKLLGHDEARAREKFGFLIDALGYGTPPHGGIAFGMDRMVMMLTGAGSIRDVIAYPKTTRAACLMTRAPSAVSDDQLAELGIAVVRGAGEGAGAK
jgi:aspartyl-tRNA synthetase